MKLDEARECLQEAGFTIVQEKRLPNETGTQLKVNGPGFSNVSVNVYDRGTYNVQGNNTIRVDEALSGASPDNLMSSATPNSATSSSVPSGDSATTDQERERIFVVHGHDEKARNELQLALLQLGLEPFVLINTSGGGLTIIEALEKEIGPDADRIRFGIVLLTPDDMGYSKSEDPEEAKPRARQNVILEMGMLMSAIGRQNVALLMKGCVEIPSDANGILRIDFETKVQETIMKLCGHLMKAGFKLDSANIVKAATSS